MAEHEPSIGQSDDWYTPPEIFTSLGLNFDLDPCSPGQERCWVPARQVYTKGDDGLSQPWPSAPRTRQYHEPQCQRIGTVRVPQDAPCIAASVCSIDVKLHAGSHLNSKE